MLHFHEGLGLDSRRPNKMIDKEKERSGTLSNQFLLGNASQTYYLNNERRDLITVRNVENLNREKLENHSNGKTSARDLLEFSYFCVQIHSLSVLNKAKHLNKLVTFK